MSPIVYFFTYVPVDMAVILQEKERFVMGSNAISPKETAISIPFDFDEAFRCNIGLVSKGELQRLRKACIAIPGLGGVGGIHAEVLTRIGISRFHIADFDRFELANFNRQFGATLDSVGKPKLETIEKRIVSINPEAEVTCFPEGVTEENIGVFLEGVDVVLDSLDAFCIEIRRKLFQAAREKKIPVISAGPLGFTAALFVIQPDGASFDEYFNLHDGLPKIDQFSRFLAGLAPSALHRPYIDFEAIDFANHRGPSSAIGVTVCASAAAAEAIKILLHRGKVYSLPWYRQYGMYRNKMVRRRLPLGNRGPLQRLKIHAIKHFLLKQSVHKQSHDSEEQKWLSMGLRAPSAENIQAWTLTKEDSSVLIRVDSTRVETCFDPEYRMSLLAVGALTENLLRSAPAFGVGVSLTCHEQGDPLDRYARLDLETIEPQPVSDLWTIGERWTNRFPYQRGVKLPGEIVELIQGEADGHAFMQCRAIQHQGTIDELAHLLQDLEQIRFSYPRENQHLLSMMRSDREERRQRDGFRIKSAGLPAMALPSLSLLRLLNAPRLMSRAPFPAMTAQPFGRAVRSSSALFLLSAPSSQPDTLIQYGRAIQRVWLRATYFGLAVQPLYAAAHFPFLASHHPDLLTDGHRETIQQYEKQVRSVFGCGEDQKPVMLFRMGVSQRRRLASQRREMLP